VSISVEAVSRQCRGSVEVVSIDTSVNGVEVCRPVSTCADLCQRADCQFICVTRVIVSIVSGVRVSSVSECVKRVERVECVKC
jgi:hypothetical protein